MRKKPVKEIVRKPVKKRHKSPADVHIHEDREGNIHVRSMDNIQQFSTTEKVLGEVISSIVSRTPSTKTVAVSLEGYDEIVDNPQSLSFEEMYRMRNDEQIKSSWRTVTLGVTSYGFRYINRSDPKAEEIGNLQLRVIENGMGIERTIEKIMPFLDFGFFVGERQNSYFPGSKISLTTSINDLKPEHIEFLQKGGQVDWFGKPVRYDQPNGEKIDLKGSSILYLANRPEFGNPYGTSELVSCYRAWWYKRGTIASWMRALERHGAPWILGKTASRSLKAKEELLETLKPISSDAIAVYGGEDEVNLVQPIFNSRSFWMAVDYFDRMIFRSRLMPALVLSEGETHGSYALGKKHFDVFLMSVLSLRRHLGRIILHKIIYPSLLWNIGPGVEIGELIWDPLKSEDVHYIMEAFVKGATRGAFNHPDMDVANTARALFDIPALTEETLDASVESYIRWYRLQKGFPAEEEDLDVGEKPKPVEPVRIKEKP
jgi:hypothetical protein